MVINNYVSIERVLETVYRHTEYDHELNWNDVIEYIGEVIDLIGVKIQYIEKVTNGTCAAPCPNPQPVVIENYMGQLPCDLVRLVQLRRKDNKVNLGYSTDNYHQYHDTDNNMLSTIQPAGFNYKIQNNIIQTSFKDGELELVYLAFPTDENGFPMVPNETKVILACAMYVIERTDYKLWRQGKISGDVYERSHKDYCFRVAQATSYLTTPSPDKAESLKNMWLRLIPNVFHARDGYKYLGHEERRYNRNTL